MVDITSDSVSESLKYNIQLPVDFGNFLFSSGGLCVCVCVCVYYSHLYFNFNELSIATEPLVFKERAGR